MSPSTVFVGDLAITIGVCAALVVYLSKYLRLLLVELCGSLERANFWVAFSNVCLVLVPVIFALDYRPEPGKNEAVVFEIAAQLKYALLGFLMSFAAIAAILLWYIPRDKPHLANTQR